ncbi:MAG: class IV adenylate cyclase [Ignavibacteriaceae bacterium]
MPINIEIKAKINNVENIRKKIDKLNTTTPVEILQEDVFFNIVKGRLKLRIFSQGEGELIYYLRNDSAGPKRSEYHIYKTNEPKTLQRVLEYSLGIRGVVRKKRLLYLVGNTRIHLDEVEHLGFFLELEVILGKGQDEKSCYASANEIMDMLDINEKDLVDIAYIDLLEKIPDSTNLKG